MRQLFAGHHWNVQNSKQRKFHTLQWFIARSIQSKVVTEFEKWGILTSFMSLKMVASPKNAFIITFIDWISQYVTNSYRTDVNFVNQASESAVSPFWPTSTYIEKLISWWLFTFGNFFLSKHLLIRPSITRIFWSKFKQNF